MKIICGLGNPGREYEGNRHNIGFMVLDVLAQHWRVNFNTNKFDAELVTAEVAGDKVLLLKPQTFMNLSGTSLSAAAHFYKVSAQNVLVVHDELDLPFAKLALKQGGGSGGHNGINSIHESWGEEQFTRLRFGIGKPTGHNARERVLSYVLGDFSREECDVLPELIGKSVDISESWTREGTVVAMNRHNGK